MRAHKKQRIFSILILTMAAVLTCIFVACGDTGSQNPSNDNGNNGNSNGATPYIRFVVDDDEYSKVQTKGNEIIVMPANPTKDGYTFVGWFWDNGTWNRPFTANSMLNEPLKNDMTVYAYFEKDHEHTYSKDWTFDATNHWHASTCGHSVVDGKAPHTFDFANICTECGYKDVALHGTDIKTNTLTLENNNISGKVPNNQEVFSFIDEITVADGATFSVSTDINGSNVIRTKTVNLAIGDNAYYILVENGKDIKLYNVSIRRRPIYTVTFNANGGTEVQSQQVEEDGFATQPTSERVGYDFVEWNYDFSKPIVKDEVVVASWNIIAYNITYDLNGGENPSDNPVTYTIEDEINLCAPTMTGYTGLWSNDGQIAKGSTGDKHFVASYTINRYNVSVLQSISSSCDYTNGGVYDFASSITLSATPYLGYDFVGWYDGDTLLSEENTFVFVVPARDCNITAKTTAKAEMQNFEFSSTNNFCTINKIKDKSATKVVIPDYVTSIGDSAFYECTGLTSINYTGDIAGWCGINGLGNLMSSSKTLYIGGNKVEGELIIPDRVKSIPSSAFYNCSELTSIVIPDSVTSIGSSAFYGCTGLTNISIPDCVTSIGWGAFSGCTGLTSIVIPDGVTSIGLHVFSGCTGLTSIVIPDGVTSIDSYAFNNCTGLTSITIPDSVTSIGKFSFKGCSSLESITIPFVGSGETEYYDYNKVFGYIFGYTTTSSSSSTVDGATKQYSTSSKNYWYYIPSSLKSVVISDKATTIPYRAFYNCSGLTSITIPDSVMGISGSAFDGCSGLTSVTIGNSVKSILDYAFRGCRRLASVTIPDSVTSINNFTFYDCSGLTSIRIPDSVTSIGTYAFRGCTGLTNVTIPYGVTSIGRGAFSGCTGLTSITIGSSVTSIGDSAFLGCTGLTSITIPDYVRSIGSSAFYGCTGLTSIVIPSGLTYIMDSTFYNCTGLTSVTIPNSVTNIGEYAFYGCINLAIVKYNGTTAQWGAIKKGTNWSYKMPSTSSIVYTGGTI